MSVRSVTMRLPVDQAAALRACRLALSRQVWDLDDAGGDGLVAHEWPWRLNCQIRPARLAVRTEPAPGEDQTVLTLEVSAPGLGPLAGRHLDNHLRGLVERIGSSPATTTAS